VSILTPTLVTLAVTGVAVALAVRDAAGLRARADAWSWSWASGLVPSGWHPRWTWPGTGRPCGPAPRVVSVEARDLSGDVPATSLPRPAAALPASPSVAPVVAADDGVAVHVVTGVPWRRGGAS
jgi:hypothetical protein